MATSATSRPPPRTLGPLWNLVLAQLVLKDCGESCSLYWPFPTSHPQSICPFGLYSVPAVCQALGQAPGMPGEPFVAPTLGAPRPWPPQTSGLGTPYGVVSALLSVCSRRHPYSGWENQEGFLEEVLFKRGWSEPREV